MNKKIIHAAAPLVLSLLVLPAQAQTVLEYETLEQKGSYILGYSQGEQMKTQGVSKAIDHEAYATGLLEGLKGAAKVLSVQEVNAIMVEFNKQLAAASASTAIVETAFFEENAKREGVVTTDSGLQYIVTTSGGGTPVPRTERSVYSVHYTGRTLTGDVIESTREQPEPRKIDNVRQLIPGFVEALSMMNPGDKYLVFIPSKLAYGASGAGNLIPPNTVLVYDIDLISID